VGCSGTLTPEQAEAVLLRLELGRSYRQIQEALGGPSPDAARMLVARGILRLSGYGRWNLTTGSCALPPPSPMAKLSTGTPGQSAATCG
jgi:hypothetical protein